ncbi:hypothetical protein MLD52_20200 [Puniceicoccaceae bacterium K14]|nr:hypothetical protein [Puniceicoccaceae bacterium K14]
MRFDEFDQFTRKLCTETEKIILRYFDSSELEIESKGDDTPVTIADRESEKTIREAIETLYPEHGIIGEEFDDKAAQSEYTWVLDPIDGTKTFVAGNPMFGTMIALLKNGDPIYGCINYPAIGKRISGDCQNAYCNGEKVTARQGVSLENAVVLVTDHFSVAEHQNGDAFHKLASQAKFVRTWGDCYGYLLLCLGRADVMLDPIMNPWDIMALIPIVRGSGAAISDWQGKDPSKGESIIAANLDIHSKVVAQLNP